MMAKAKRETEKKMTWGRAEWAAYLQQRAEHHRAHDAWMRGSFWESMADAVLERLRDGEVKTDTQN